MAASIGAGPVSCPARSGTTRACAVETRASSHGSPTCALGARTRSREDARAIGARAIGARAIGARAVSSTGHLVARAHAKACADSAHSRANSSFNAASPGTISQTSGDHLGAPLTGSGSDSDANHLGALFPGSGREDLGTALPISISGSGSDSTSD